MRYPVFVSALALVCLSFPAKSEDEKKSSSAPPNIVFILLDAARADHFSSYGYDKETTPSMDALGKKGAIFLKNYAPATETYISLPLILTSRYFSKPIFQMDAWEWGIRRESPENIFKQFDEQQVLLPALLSKAGYRTALFHNHPWFDERTDLARAFDESYIFPTVTKEPVDDIMTDAVLAWIREHRKEKFFIYYHVMSPHQPYPPKPEDLDFIEKKEMPALSAFREKFATGEAGDIRDWTADDLHFFRVMYDSNLKHTDRRIGRLYAGLEELGLAENTLFIITADHGELLGEHGRIGHGDFLPWENLVHIPLIMIYPPLIPPGLRVGGLTEAIDIMPAILEVLGDGTQSKSYIHVFDVIAAMLYAHENADERVNVFNVATDDYIDVTSIAGIVIEEIGLDGVELNYSGGDRGWKGDVPKVRFNLDKIHQSGWKSKYNSEEAIRLSIREMLKN